MEKPNITRNEEHHGIEICFQHKPDAMIINQLKESGFRWHRMKKLWYAKENKKTLSLVKELLGDERVEEQKIKNADGVEVGDLYVASWGYEQTNVTFFQVRKVSQHCAWFVEVSPKIVSEKAVSGMSCHRVYENTKKLLPPVNYSRIIKNTDTGDRKTTKNTGISFNSYIYMQQNTQVRSFTFHGMHRDIV